MFGCLFVYFIELRFYVCWHSCFPQVLESEQEVQISPDTFTVKLNPDGTEATPEAKAETEQTGKSILIE